MKVILKLIKVVLKLLKPLIKLGLFDGLFEDIASQLCEEYTLDFNLI